MKHYYLIILVLALPFFLTAQTWTYSSSEDPFDGKYRTSQIIGTSDNSTYRNPTICFNYFEKSGKFNLYATGIGYICDGVSVLVKFENSDDTYYLKSTTSNKQSILFLYDGDVKHPDGSYSSILKFELVNLMKQYSKMYIRISDDCDVMDCEFSLAGSSRAINYVYGAKKEEITELIVETKRKEVEMEEERKRRKGEKKEQLRLEEVRRDSLKRGKAVIQNISKDGIAIVFNDAFTKSNPIFINFSIRNDTVDILDTSEDRVKIKTSDDKEGWILKSFVYQIELE